MQINYNTLTTAILNAVVGKIARDKWNISIKLSSFYYNSLKESHLDFTKIINSNFISSVDTLFLTLNGIDVMFIKDNSLMEDQLKIYNNTDLIENTTFKEIDNKYGHLAYNND